MAHSGDMGWLTLKGWVGTRGRHDKKRTWPGWRGGQSAGRGSPSPPRPAPALSAPLRLHARTNTHTHSLGLSGDMAARTHSQTTPLCTHMNTNSNDARHQRDAPSHQHATPSTRHPIDMRDHARLCLARPLCLAPLPPHTPRDLSFTFVSGYFSFQGLPQGLIPVALSLSLPLCRVICRGRGLEECVHAGSLSHALHTLHTTETKRPEHEAEAEPLLWRAAAAAKRRAAGAPALAGVALPPLPAACPHASASLRVCVGKRASGSER